MCYHFINCFTCYIDMQYFLFYLLYYRCSIFSLFFIPIHANSYSNISNCVCQYRIIIEFFVDFFMYKFMNFHLTKPTKAIMISL